MILKTSCVTVLGVLTHGMVMAAPPPIIHAESAELQVLMPSVGIPAWVTAGQVTLVPRTVSGEPPDFNLPLMAITEASLAIDEVLVEADWLLFDPAAATLEGRTLVIGETWASAQGAGNGAAGAQLSCSAGQLQINGQGTGTRPTSAIPGTRPGGPGMAIYCMGAGGHRVGITFAGATHES